MKNSKTICKLLGTTQEEMAMLLRVSRSQWSMFESGKRDLPLASLHFLSEILLYMQSPEAKTTKNLALVKETTEKKQTLEALVKENQYQQLRMTKKIADIEKKQKLSTAAMQVVDYLNKQNDKQMESSADLLKKIETRATKAISLNGISILVTYQIKQAVLQKEELVLKAALQELS